MIDRFFGFNGSAGMILKNERLLAGFCQCIGTFHFFSNPTCQPGLFLINCFALYQKD